MCESHGIIHVQIFQSWWLLLVDLLIDSMNFETVTYVDWL